eukprot:6326-Heterococcus_DN1.PRE.2
MLTAAQEAHPVVPEVSRHSHTFKHPYAKPEAAPSAPPAAAVAAVAAADEQQAETMQDDGSSDESPAPKRRARTASDLEAVAMNDVSTAVLYVSILYRRLCFKMTSEWKLFIAGALLSVWWRQRAHQVHSFGCHRKYQSVAVLVVIVVLTAALHG